MAVQKKGIYPQLELPYEYLTYYTLYGVYIQHVAATVVITFCTKPLNWYFVVCDKSILLNPRSTTGCLTEPLIG